MRFKPFAIAATLIVTGVSLALAFTNGDSHAAVKQPFDPSGHGKPSKASAQILYHGGPVMNQSNSVYVIYYGTFLSTTQPIINDFLVGLSGNGPFTVNSSYSQPPSGPSIPITYAFTSPSSTTNPSGGSVYYDAYSQGTQLGSSSVPLIVASAIANGLPANQNGVYIVVTSPDVKISGFCKSFCAYHNTSATIYAGLHIRYALIPDPTQRCSGCNGGIAVYSDTVTPNGDMGADTMTDDIMHELSETVTDPDISAWYTKSGEENGDLCNYVYDTTPPSLVKTTATGAHYNVTLNGRNFLVQLIWKNSGAGFCAAQ